MIKYKVIPSTVNLEIKGPIVQKLLPDLTDIEKIQAVSDEFSSDLEAFNVTDEKLNQVARDNDLESELNFNPEFFNDGADFLLDNNENYQPLNNGNVVYKISREFDETGDFVSIRKRFFSDDSEIILRIVVNPSIYAENKVKSFFKSKQEVEINDEHRIIFH